jgi:hypothetical protein
MFSTSTIRHSIATISGHSVPLRTRIRLARQCNSRKVAPMDELGSTPASVAALADGELARVYRVTVDTVVRFSLLPDGDVRRETWLGPAEQSALALGTELLDRGLF